MPTATFRIPDMDFATTLKTYERVCHRTGAELLRDRAGMLGRYMAASTQPARPTGSKNPPGGTSEERQLGMNAVKGDIAKIIDGIRLSGSPLPAKGQADRLVLRNVKGDVYLVDRDLYMDSAPDVHRFHQSRRDARGRVSNAGMANPRVGRWKSRNVAVTTKALRDAELRKAQKRVGFAKRGWLNAARQISSYGLSKVPAWLQSSDAPGTGTFNGGARPFIRLTNEVAYAGTVLRPGYEAAALSGFYESLKKDMKIQIEHELSKLK